MNAGAGGAVLGKTFFQSDIYGSPILAADGQGVLQQYAEYDIWGGLNVGTESWAGSGRRPEGTVLSGLEENLRFTSYRYDPVIGKYFAQARFYDSVNGRMLGKDPVKRGLNPYRYCDDDPVDYVDPTGEVLNIIGGAVLGGVFGGAAGLVSSAVSQALSGEKIDWRKAGGAATRGFITGAVQGGLMASGAGFPLAFAANFLAGTTGSAAEQYISTGQVDTRKSITSGLTNAVSNMIYGTNPLRSVKEAFGKGTLVGAATSAIDYLSDFTGQKPVVGGVKVELLSGITGAAVSPFVSMRDPRRGCGSASPFTPGIGYSSAKGYRYDIPRTAVQPQSQCKGFSLKDFAIQTIIGGLTGGFTSAAFYGAGKGIERIKTSIAFRKPMAWPESEAALARRYGGKSQQRRHTTRGWRIIDQLSDEGIAHESKVGYTSLTQRTRSQILKDAELVANKKIIGAHWHFFRSKETGKIGATQQLLEFLEENGIPYTIHK